MNTLLLLSLTSLILVLYSYIFQRKKGMIGFAAITFAMGGFSLYCLSFGRLFFRFIDISCFLASFTMLILMIINCKNK